jgi:hypothetical protein
MCEAARPRTETLPKTMTDLMPRSVFSFSALLRDQIHKTNITHHEHHSRTLRYPHRCG